MVATSLPDQERGLSPFSCCRLSPVVCPATRERVVPAPRSWKRKSAERRKSVWQVQFPSRARHARSLLLLLSLVPLPPPFRPPTRRHVNVQAYRFKRIGRDINFLGMTIIFARLLSNYIFFSIVLKNAPCLIYFMFYFIFFFFLHDLFAPFFPLSLLNGRSSRKRECYYSLSATSMSNFLGMIIIFARLLSN